MLKKNKIRHIRGVRFLYGRVAEPCHFSAAPAPVPFIFFTAPAPTYIDSHQFLKINAYGTLFFH